MEYGEVCAYLEGLSKYGSRPGLKNITYLLYLIGNPEKKIKIIHIAGTNGKGSTSSMLFFGHVKSGYRVGLYTSPHLLELNERIKINNNNIDKKEFSRILSQILPMIKKVSLKKGFSHPTFFEVLTAVSLFYFAEKGVDFAILETGMGGRFDATNISYPLVSLLTHIDIDHTNFLGYTLSDIAMEKCGIIKGGIPIVSALQYQDVYDVIKKVAMERSSQIYFSAYRYQNDLRIDIYGTYFTYMDESGNRYKVRIPLIGSHQKDNAVTAIYTAEILSFYWDYDIPLDLFIEGIKDTYWPGRFQIIQGEPLIVLDGAHNLDGIRSLKETIIRLFPDRNIINVSGILRDKEYKKMVETIAPVLSKVITTTPNNSRALSSDELKIRYDKYIRDVISIESPVDAFTYAMSHAKKDDIVLVSGSLYLVGEIEKFVRNHDIK